MASKYEQKINQMAETLARIDERDIGLSNRLYDKDGDIPAIKEHLVKINSTNQMQQTQIDQNTNDVKSLPLSFLSKKWFWVIAGIVVLSALGLNVSDVKAIIGLVSGT